MRLHYIERDLEQHDWYVELAADLVAVVERFLAYVVAEQPELEDPASPSS